MLLDHLSSTLTPTITTGVAYAIATKQRLYAIVVGTCSLRRAGKCCTTYCVKCLVSNAYLMSTLEDEVRTLGVMTKDASIGLPHNEQHSWNESCAKRCWISLMTFQITSTTTFCCPSSNNPPFCLQEIQAAHVRLFSIHCIQSLTSE